MDLIYEIEGSKGTKTVNSSLYTKKQMMNIITDLSTFDGFPPEPDKYVMKNGNKIPLWFWAQYIILYYSR